MNTEIKNILPLDMQYVLNENTNILSGEIETLEAVKEFIKNTVTDLIGKFDNTGQFRMIDNSKGKISNLKNYPQIIDSISKLEEKLNKKGIYLTQKPSKVYENYKEEIPVQDYLATVKKSILYISNNSNVYINAYKVKNTLEMLDYTANVAALIRAVAVLIAKETSGDLTDNGMVEANKSIIALSKYNNSVETKTFYDNIEDAERFHEEFADIYTNKDVILESFGVMAGITSGLKSILNKLVDNPKINKILYYATKIINLLINVKDAIYPLLQQGQSLLSYVKLITGFASMPSFGDYGDLNMSNDLDLSTKNLAKDISKNTYNIDYSADSLIRQENQKMARDLQGAIQSKREYSNISSSLLDF